MKTVSCQIQSLSSLTPHVYKVLLKPDEKVDFIAGQYLNFIMSDEDKRPFSIASSPNSELIELQIGAFIADSYPMQVIERLQAAQAANEPVSIEIPLGNAELRLDSERPLLLLAGGTGFSYIKSMFEYLSQQKSSRKVVVYWGLREPSACYELEKSADIIAQLTQGEFHPVVDVKKVSELAIKKLIVQKERLTGNQVKFIRSFFSMTLRSFAVNVVSESHTAVSKWEKSGNEATKMDINIEKILRMYMFEKVCATTKKEQKEFFNLYMSLKEMYLKKVADPFKLTYSS